MSKIEQYASDIVAATTALTRLPLGKWIELPRSCYERIIYYWSVVGWLTGALTALVVLVAGIWLPTYAAVAIGFIFRILLTGGLHEDGLMDFFDGFGGGTSRERTLEIMKDSHTGAYAVMGFVGYAALWIALLGSLPLTIAVVAIAIGDPMSKFVASNIPYLLTYARQPEEAKMGVKYQEKVPRGLFILAAHFGLLPISLCPQIGWWMLLFSAVTFGVLVGLMKKRIGGYTGDCCGATFLLCEVISYVAIWLVI